ncbi:MAG: XcyI family restriction endonuclease [Elusimicrobia bacterium]|nr:XcyI family restriction endonuclease [Elusimicrobiota bacterium]
MSKSQDKHLLDALIKAYTARAQLFHKGVALAKVDLLIAEIDKIDQRSLRWNFKQMGISESAFQRVKKAGGLPHQVFSHPDIITSRPHLIAYYRNIVTISQKGVAQILFPSVGFETGRKDKISLRQALQMSETFNRIISGVIDSMPDYSPKLSRQAILAEIGT